jgi:hypothetical protein
MAWIEGNQKKATKNPLEIYDKINGLEGFLREDIAKKYLFELMQQDITLTAYMLMGIKLAPHQHIAIKAMMNNDYVLNIWGRGSAKTFSAAVAAGLIALFNPGIQIGILSASFRQSRMCVMKLEEIINSEAGALFNQCTGRILHKTDEWSIEIGKSKILALPLGSGEKLRGFRFQCLIIDELLLMPKKTLNEVILPFLSSVPNPTERREIEIADNLLISLGEIEEKDRIRWPNNKFIGLSSASYKFEYLYELYKVYEALIMGGISDSDEPIDANVLEKFMQNDTTRAVLHLSYEAIPEWFYEQSLITQAKESMSDAQFDREFRSIFKDEGGGFYDVKIMRTRTIEDGQRPCLKIAGDKRKKYILSVDPNWSTGKETSDDFAMCVVELDENDQTWTVVHCYARHGGTLKEHISYFHYLYTYFNIEMVWIDQGGGHQFIGACNESSLFTEMNIELKFVDEDFDDIENYQKCLRNARNNMNKQDHKIVFERMFGKGDWIRVANQALQASLNNKRIWFGARCMDETYEEQLSMQIPENISFTQPEEDKEYMEEDPVTRKTDLIYKQFDLLNLTKAECALIEVKSNPKGGQTFDLPPNLKRQSGANRARKDSYTALLLANWGSMKYFDVTKGKDEDDSEGFMPFFIA